MSYHLPFASPIAAPRSFCGVCGGPQLHESISFRFPSRLHTCISVSDFADPVLGSGTKQFCSFWRCQLIVLGNPARHVCGSALKRIIKRPPQSHGHDVCRRFHSGPGRPGITSTVNSTSNDVSSALPFNSPSPCAACPSPKYRRASPPCRRKACRATSRPERRPLEVIH